MNQRGFTLLEVLLASVILAVLGTFTYGALAATFRTERAIAKRTNLQDLGTAILIKLEDDFTQLFHVQAVKPLTYFKALDNMDHDRVSFTSLSHTPSSRDARECDQAEITYETESNPQNAGLFLLRRRESSLVDDRPDEGGDFTTLADNIVAFNLDYSDGQQFRPAWDSRALDQLNKLPKLVRVVLKLRDDGGREETFETLIAIPMSEDLRMDAKAAGVPPGQPGGNPGQGRPHPSPGSSGGVIP